MPTFRYQTISGDVGGGASGTIDAPDRTTAVRLLVEQGRTPSEVELVQPGSRGASKRVDDSEMSLPMFGGGMSRGEVAAMVSELAIAVSAGLPLVSALKTLARQGRKAKQAAIINAIIEEVEHGKTLSDAMRAQGRVFSDLLVSLVRAGEVSGRLDVVLTQAAMLLERDIKIRRTLGGALIYPAIIAGAVVVAVIVVVTVIVPRVLKAVEGQMVTLPLPTRIVEGMAAFFGAWWWAVIFGLCIAVLGFVRLRRDAAARLWMDTMVLRLPVAGRLLRDVAVARFTRTFGTLTGAGLPVMQALKITKATLNNKAMEAAIDEVAAEVAHGSTIADPLEASGHFPPLLVQVIAMGERTGKLDEMLSQSADAMESKTEQSIKLFTAVLPPILIMLLALVVGFVILSILLPLLELQEAIG
ncbi:MAG: type II secretion system F family protein [Phycisphaerales bacterium]|nr:type II secretion system F family protein [Phycisphaerales bacterium]